MNNEPIIPHMSDDPSVIMDWLDYANDAFEAHHPLVDLTHIFKNVLKISIEHNSKKIREEAYDVLRKYFLKHNSMDIDLTELCKNLPYLNGEELLWAVSTVCMSCDKKYNDYIKPFERHADPRIRNEVFQAQVDFE